MDEGQRGRMGADGAGCVAGRALTAPLLRMHRSFPAGHVAGRDADRALGRNAHRSEICLGWARGLWASSPLSSGPW